MVKITLSISNELARKAYILLTDNVPTDEQLGKLSEKEIDFSELEKEDKEQALMMAMAFIGLNIEE